MPKIGIIIPVHNLGLYIYDCLKSCIAGNRDPDVTITLINDASTDNSQAEIERFCADFPAIAISIHQTSGIGPGAARNLALDAMDTDYVLFVDGDDLISRANLAGILQEMDASNADMCCPNIVAFDDAGRFRFDFDRPELRRKLLNGRNSLVTQISTNAEILDLETSMCMRIFRMSFLREAGIRFSDARFCEDVFPSRKAFLLADKVLISSRDYYFYRQNRIAQRTSAASPSTMDLIAVLRQTIDFARQRHSNKVEGAWILSRSIDTAVWGAQLVPQDMLKDFAAQITLAFEQAPKDWWAALNKGQSFNTRQKIWARYYLYHRSRKSRERIVYNLRYRLFDRLWFKFFGLLA